jgi:hypothetical protein
MLALAGLSIGVLMLVGLFVRLPAKKVAEPARGPLQAVSERRYGARFDQTDLNEGISDGEEAEADPIGRHHPG